MISDGKVSPLLPAVIKEETIRQPQSRDSFPGLTASNKGLNDQRLTLDREGLVTLRSLFQVIAWLSTRIIISQVLPTVTNDFLFHLLAFSFLSFTLPGDVEEKDRLSTS